MDAQSVASLARFVGREAEMDILRRALDDAGAGRGRSVFVSGEPGIGKRRTAEELATYAQSRGAQVLWGRCYEGDGAPAFWPWVQILRAALRNLDDEALATTLGSGAADIAQLLPELRERLPEIPSAVVIDSPQARFRMFDHIARFLEHLTRRAPVVLIVDDIHGADPSSLRLIEFVARELGPSPLMLLGCYRDGVEPSTHPLRQMLVEVLRLPGAQRLTFPGFSVSEVAQFLEVSAGAPPATALVTALHQRTEGNPLFVTEYVRLLLSVPDQSAIRDRWLPCRCPTASRRWSVAGWPRSHSCARTR